MAKKKKNNGLRIFNNGVAIVTGAASGIGLAISRELSRQGCEVVLTDRQADRIEKEAEAIRSRGGKADWAKLDVRSFRDVDNLVRETVARTGRLDYMFNNAGIGIGGPTHECTVDAWDEAIDVNLRGVCYGVQAAYPIMRQQGYGHIVNTASLAGLVTVKEMAAYTATKHGVVGLSKTLCAEAMQYGVRVSVVCPGVIDTEILTGGEYGILHGITGDDMRNTFSNKAMDVNIFAEKTLKDIAKNKVVIIHPCTTRFAWWLIRLLPISLQIRSGNLFIKDRKQ
jgi:short-subunit dehydrogenase